MLVVQKTIGGNEMIVTKDTIIGDVVMQDDGIAPILMAAGLAQLNPVSILPYLYYPFAIGIAALLAILLRYPRRFS